MTGGMRAILALGEAYKPPAEAQLVVRDRSAALAGDLYSVCYVNAFQTQPGELEDWPREALLISEGDPVIDPGWPDEVLLDTSNAEARALILDTVRPWVESCAADGFDAIEFDNLDSYTRSEGALSFEGNLALARELTSVAHAHGLAAAQKNAAEHSARLRDDAGFDFAIAEECAAYGECSSYTQVYGDHVLAIEYTDMLTGSFAEMCSYPGAPSSMILRDRELVAAQDAGYAYESCGS